MKWLKMVKKVFWGLVIVFFLTPQITLVLSENTLLVMCNARIRPLICILVNSTIYADIKTSLDQYVLDVSNSGFNVKTVETSQLSEATPAGIKSYLDENMRYGLTGCLLIGDIPSEWFEIGSQQFPIDLYYMDLDGTWVDSDNDTIYDEHSGDASPEIWVGRLKVPQAVGDEVSVLNNYFDKNHRYRTGMLTLPWWRGMIYIDDGGTNTKTLDDAVSSLSQIYSDITFVKDRAATNATDYKNRLRDPLGYQWMYIMCHGTHNNHTFMVPSNELETSQESWFQWDGTVYSSDYRTVNPRIFFYHFVVCSAAKYTEPDYLAGSAVFGNDYGLLAVGSTLTISTLPVGDFYGALSEGKCIGEAFHEWLVVLNEKHDNIQRQFYGLTLIGDPTLQLYHEVHDVAVTNVLVSLTNLSGTETLTIEVAVENQGEFNENFDVFLYYDFTKLENTNVDLTAGAKKTLTFNFTLDRNILGYHTVEAKTSTLLGELDTDDNVLRTNFKGKLTELPVNPRKPFFPLLIQAAATLFVFVACGIFALFFLKTLMTERLPLLSYFVKVKIIFFKILSG